MQALALQPNRRKLFGCLINNSDESRIYHWGYWAVRYMFEQRPDDIERLVLWFRLGRYDDYQDWLDDEAKELDAGFAKWMGKVRKELQVASGV
ncbi:conserved hypothetical protein [Hahella chejuensis KCTC 2396]|uniref:Uncharacterized protein n=1 Tax=Hahella chejuensis (strain KCTC 2396) TaxID=349521 RepID=Q2SKC2_HAHCH|nr:collagenase [Hahella chejuensis]ABC28902.1 conserved hypothetical protein [Hahella chejuensis KCTC 2396]